MESDRQTHYRLLPDDTLRREDGLSNGADNYDSLLEEIEEKTKAMRKIYTYDVDSEDAEIEDLRFPKEEEDFNDATIKTKTHYWAPEFNRIARQIKDEDLFEERKIYRELSKLGKDFVHAAQLYGKVIISERYLPDDEKSFTPIDMGRAGGEKYIVHDILFKFAVDVHGIFGGNDAHAAKVAGHELKSLVIAYGCKLPNLYFPLLCLVDYLGFRLIAVSLLPISKSTLTYGSDDAGIHVKNGEGDTEVQDLMRELAAKLNLKGHYAGVSRSRKFMYGPVDCEVHRGYDGKLYLLDFARLMPPEALNYKQKINKKNQKNNQTYQNSQTNQNNNKKKKNTPESQKSSYHLFRLLRPELVKSNLVPLSSDAFTLFGRESSSTHNKEVLEATHRLYTEIIPNFAVELVEFEIESLSIKTGKEIGDILVELLHTKGINCRHLGIVRKHIQKLRENIGHKINVCEADKWERICFREIISRHIKNHLFQRWRDNMKRVKEPREQVYQIEATSLLNLYFGNSEISNHFWKSSKLKKLINIDFPETLETNEITKFFDLRNILPSLTSLFDRVKQLTRLEFSPHCKLDLDEEETKKSKPLVVTDIVEIPPRVKIMNIMAYSEAVSLLCSGLRKTQPKERKRLSCMAMDILRPILKSVPLDPLALSVQAHHYTFIGDLKAAEWYYRRAIEASEYKNARIMNHWAWFLHTRLGNDDEAEKFYKLCLKENPTHCRALGDYAYFLYVHRKDNVRARKYFKRCIRFHTDYKQAVVDYAKYWTHVGNQEKSKKYWTKADSMRGMVIGWSGVFNLEQ